MRIGIIKEGKVPIDKRTALTPENSKKLLQLYPKHEIICEPSDLRCFPDSHYQKAGIPLENDVTTADILIGVKEVPIDRLIPNKTYLFFSHTIKKQAYNRKLLQAVLQKKIRLFDYEKLYNQNGQRIVAFGRFAGIVGAYNGIWTYGKKFNHFTLRRAHECIDLEDLKTEFKKVKLPAIKIVLTGGGRVSRGSMEVLKGMNIKQVSPKEFIEKDFKEAVFTQLDNEDYNEHKEGKEFKDQEFFQHPEQYKSSFSPYTKAADLLIAGAYWDPSAPRLFEIEDMLQEDFNIKVIADITCDIEGSIPSTVKSTTIEHPVYDFNPQTGKAEDAFSKTSNVSVMAVDNLPCEVPRDASTSFSNDLLKHTLPLLLKEKPDPHQMIHQATITKADGTLNEPFLYLQNYADGKE